MEFSLMTKILLLHISVTGVESDGVDNHLLFSDRVGQSSYAVSFSADEPLPFKKNKWFKATVTMECANISSGGEGPSHICNAAELTIKGVKYKTSSKRGKYGG